MFSFKTVLMANVLLDVKSVLMANILSDVKSVLMANILSDVKSVLMANILSDVKSVLMANVLSDVKTSQANKNDHHSSGGNEKNVSQEGHSAIDVVQHIHIPRKADPQFMMPVHFRF